MMQHKWQHTTYILVFKVCCELKYLKINKKKKQKIQYVVDNDDGYRINYVSTIQLTQLTMRVAFYCKIKYEIMCSVPILMRKIYNL